MTAATAGPETTAFQADVNRLLHLVVHSLYSHKEVFLRELVSNASDALDKLQFRALTEHDILGDAKDLEVRIVLDAAAKTIGVEDTGAGMTREELAKNLGTIAHSGTRAFVEAAKEKGGAAASSLIGEFGVGFYSSFLVADKVEVVSRAAGSAEAWKWTSDARGTFSIERAERAARGTAVTLHVRDEQKEFLDERRLRELVRRYSDYVSHPIKLGAEVVNAGSALWQRSKAEVKDEQYDEFYKHLAHDHEKPLARTHFTFEGTQLFTALLFVPRRPPFDLFDRSSRRGVRLYVRRVFIMDDCEQLVPEWLRFLRGVVDSDDLPLNVSRELLQQESVVRTIRNNVVRKTLEMLEDLASRPDEYELFWESFGAVLKEGLHFDRESKERLAKLCRFASSRDDAPLVSLADYVGRMAAGQQAIYYVLADTRRAAASSPHIEALRTRGFEVLYLTDPVDEWAVEALREFEGKKLLSAMKADLALGGAAPGSETGPDAGEKLKALREKFQEVLSERVREVRLSERLTDSPCCLVVPEGGLHPNIERLLRARDRDVPASKRILELNPTHPLVLSLEALRAKEPAAPRVKEWTLLLHDQALLAEGSPIDDPGAFARRVTALLAEAAAREAAGA